jgi:lysophospholipase L1-like esterase
VEAGNTPSPGVRPRPAALLFLGLFGLAIALIVAEGAVRLAGFRFSRYPVVQFGWPDPKTLQQQYRSDRVLVWVPRDYDARLDRARHDRPAVVFMGDSCTEFGKYPAFTLDALRTERADLARGVALGVGGWSSEQGRHQLDRDVLPLAPKVVSIYFGWNDHWIALGPPDSKIKPPLFPDWMSENSRLAQLAEFFWLGRPAAQGRRPNRVPPARYEENLTAMVRDIHASGAEAVLITAASSHVTGQEPPYLAARHLRRLQDLVPVHREYVEMTRAVAHRQGAVLCDAAAAFEKLDPPIGRYFHQDGIHMTDDGDRALATLLAGCIVRATHQPTDRSTEQPTDRAHE